MLNRRGKDGGVQSKPQILTWITCDGVHIDPGSGKHTLLGVFSNIKARRFPVVHPRMMWFLTLTDVTVGKHTVRILFGLGVDHPKPIVSRQFESQSPLQRINLINEIRNLAFSEPGDYSITIEIDDEPVLVTSLPVNS